MLVALFAVSIDFSRQGQMYSWPIVLFVAVMGGQLALTILNPALPFTFPYYLRLDPL